MITVEVVFHDAVEEGARLLAERLRIALHKADAVSFLRDLVVDDLRERKANDWSDLSVTEREPMRLVRGGDVAGTFTKLESGFTEEVFFSLVDSSGREVFGGGAERHISGRGQPTVDTVDIGVVDPVDPLGPEVSGWCLELLRDWVSAGAPVYGRVTLGGGSTWWEVQKRKSRRGESRESFYPIADRHILNPDWAMFLTESHLAAVGVNTLEDIGATLESIADGMIVRRTPELLDLKEIDLDAWIDCLRPILW